MVCTCISLRLAGQSPSPGLATSGAGTAFPGSWALDDDLVAGIGQPVQGAVAQDGVVKDAEPFLHGPVAGDDKAGDPVAVEDELVEVGGLLGRSRCSPRSSTISRSGVRKDLKARSTELSTLAWAMARKKLSA